MSTSYIAIDTETIGLPTTRGKATADNVPAFDKCRLLSIAMVEYDENHNELSHYYELVYPDNFKVDATHIHGIDQETAEKNGKPFDEIYKKISDLTCNCPVLLGHNLEFDINVIKSEMYRRGYDVSPMQGIKTICTLQMTKSIYLKSMKLTVLYEMFTGKPLEGAHGALADTRAAAVIYPYLLADPRVYKPIKAKRVIVKASEVAACVGLNFYKPSTEVLDDMWKKYNPSNFTGKTKEDRHMDALRISDISSKVVEAAIASKPKNSAEVQEVVTKAAESINKDDNLNQEQKKLVIEHLRKMVYTNHGTESEDTTADLDDKELHVDNKFYTLKLINIEGTQYEIVGRIDRYQIKEDGSKVLIEIKNRAKGLFNHVKSYEMVQVQTYLQMLDLKEARLIEQHNNDRKHYMIDRNDELWNDKVLPKLVGFCKTLHNCMCN